MMVNSSVQSPTTDAAKAAAKSTQSPSSKTPPGGKGVQQRDSPTVPVMFVDRRPPSAGVCFFCRKEKGRVKVSYNFLQ